MPFVSTACKLVHFMQLTEVQVILLDKRSLMQALPQQFKHLVELKGLQRALEIVITIVTQ
jgi:hypothetical protein